VKPADAHALTVREAHGPRSRRRDATHDLMTRHDARARRREVALDDVQVRAADAAHRNVYENLAVPGHGLGQVLEPQGLCSDRSGLVQDHGAHERECILAAVNLILLEPEDFVDAGRVCLRGRRLEHVREILRAEPGDVLRVGVVDGELGSGSVSRVASDALELDVTLGEAPPEASPFALALALPRPPQLRRVLQNAAALGVKQISLFHSARVEKSFWQSSGLAPAAVREQLLLGLEQARDTRLPHVDLERRFRPFVEDRLAGLGAGPILVAHPEASEPCPHALQGPATLVVGPEGGFVDFELERLAAAGGRRVGLGARVLRVETAVTALLARLTP